MPEIELWYHDEGEVDERHSWLANSTFLSKKANRNSYDNCSYSRVLSLVEYARPDFIVTVDGVPLLSAELTKMNPSGHNLPQRFSCLVRAAEMGVPSLFYYPKYARRSDSDPNPRYLNIRTPLAQLRMGEIYKVPSISIFWPTDENTLLPTDSISQHSEIAKFVEYTVKLFLAAGKILSASDTEVKKLEANMLNAAKSVSQYSINESYRVFFPDGDAFTKKILYSESVDPPNSCCVENTESLLTNLYLRLGKRFSSFLNQKKVKLVLSRENTFVFQGTANRNKTGPEHPFPGYLTLLDILYLREEGGQTTRDRSMNLAFKLPISVEAFKENALNRPTGLNILMEFSDFIILDDAIVLGGWMRNVSSGAILARM